MKFIQFDSAGLIVARFDEDPIYLPHPDGTVEVDDVLWTRTFVESDGIWSRDPNTGEITKLPFPAAPATQKTRFTVREFAKRFSLDEQVAIRRASLDDMEVGLIYDDFNRAEFIDIEDPDVSTALAFYVSKGLLDADRAEQLLTPVFEDSAAQ